MFGHFNYYICSVCIINWNFIVIILINIFVTNKEVKFGLSKQREVTLLIEVHEFLIVSVDWGPWICFHTYYYGLIRKQTSWESQVKRSTSISQLQNSRGY